MNNDELMHVGKGHDDNPPGRGSGRWKWGSGDNPYQHLEMGRQKTVQDRLNYLKSQGMTEAEALDNMGISSSDYRSLAAIEIADKRKDQYLYAVKRMDEGETNTSKIARELGVTEGKVRGFREEAKKEKIFRLDNVCDQIKQQVDEKKILDVGEAVEDSLGITETMKHTALTKLTMDGDYHIVNIQTPQPFNPSKKTTHQLLCPKDIDIHYIYDHTDEIRYVDESRRVDLDGTIKLGAVNPRSVDRKRVLVKYDEDGGSVKDGVIELRRGVPDISIGANHYAQVRIAVDDKMYMKGMAYYNDETFKNLPKGIDMVYYSNKKRGTEDITSDNTGVFKKLKDDSANPFGATIKGLYDEDAEDGKKELKLTQRYYTDENGKKQLSCINIVSEEGTWDGWSKTLSSQFLSKQSGPLAKRQLDLNYKKKVSEFEDIMKITEPAVKEKMLQDFAESCDRAAVDLKGAAFNRQTTAAILPIASLKDNEIYAPNYKTGERVCAIRYPHEGIFEIAYLRVNNNNREGKSVLAGSRDAVGINPNVANQLSGADFDGDNAVIFPVGRDGQEDYIKIRHMEPVKELIDFNTKIYKMPTTVDPKTGEIKYPYKPLDDASKQIEMGKATNLMSDMTLIKGNVVDDESIRVTKYCMVVIDAAKHKLDYKKAYKDLGIADIKKKYRGSASAGASTIVSARKSPLTVPEYRTKIDPETGKLIKVPTKKTRDDLHVVKEKDPVTGKMVDKIDPVTGKKVWENRGKVPVMVTSNKMTEAFLEGRDAYSITSDKKGERYKMEGIYAEYANNMNALGNRARKESLGVVYRPYSPSAAETYKKEVEDLELKYMEVRKNKPLERSAQAYYNSIMKIQLNENPSLKEDKDKLKKVKNQALAQARATTGAKSEAIFLTDREWEAIQSGAVRKTKLKQILNKTDPDNLRQHAMPKAENKALTPAKKSIILAMYANGNGVNQADIADQLGISLSTVKRVLAS